MTGLLRYARRKARIIICGRQALRIGGYGLCLMAALCPGLAAGADVAAAAQPISRPQVQTPQVQTPKVQPPAAPVAPQPAGGQARGPQPPDYSVPAPAQPMPALGGGGSKTSGAAPAPVSSPSCAVRSVASTRPSPV